MSTTYVSGPYTSGQLLQSVRAIEDAVTRHVIERGPVDNEGEQQSMAGRLLDVSQGRNTVLFDDLGYPSIMVRFPAYTLDKISMGDYRTLHPAFIVNGRAVPEIWIGKYHASSVGSGSSRRPVSLRGMDPWAGVTLNAALDACFSKNGGDGAGWHIMTNAEFAAIALWCHENGFYPRGNNQYGRDYRRQDEKGLATYVAGGNVSRVGGGTGPVGWSHDGTPLGIWDLNGNVYDWVGGMQLDDGEIQIIPNNDAATDPDQPFDSPAWRAILEDGTLVEPGTDGTLKYNTSPSIHLSLTSNLDEDSQNRVFSDVDAPGLSVPDILVQLGLMPPGPIGTGGGNRIYMRTAGERGPRRGGSWAFASSAGVFLLSLSSGRSSSDTGYGFRPAWVE